MLAGSLDMIAKHLKLLFTYDGLLRVAQPAAVGESTVGNKVLRCYQTQGGHVVDDHDWNLCTELQKNEELKIKLGVTRSELEEARAVISSLKSSVTGLLNYHIEK